MDGTTTDCLGSMGDEAATPPTGLDVDLLQGVAATGTLRGAAKAARVKQTTASRHLDRMERRLGVALTTGCPDNLKLTDAGVAVLTSGHRFQRRFTEAVQRITGQPGASAQRTLRMAAVGTDWDEFVDEVAVNLPALLPAVVSAGPEECQALFDTYNVDGVYTWQPFGEGHRLSRSTATYSVVDEPLWIGLPSGHPCAARATVSLLDLRTDEWILGPEQSVRDALLAACAKAGFEPRVRHVAESTSVVRSMLWQGSGIALLPPVSAPPGDGANFAIRPLADGPHRPYVLITDPTLVPDRLARTLCQRLRASYRTRARRVNPAYAASLDGPDPARPAPADLWGLTSGLAGPAQPEEPTEDPIEPEDVVMLRAIGQSGSLNRAAPTLLISQPALTRRLKLMERRLGMKLLVRGYRGTSLTARARELVDAVTDAEQDYQRALRRLADRPRGFAQWSRVAVPDQWGERGTLVATPEPRPSLGRV